MTGELIVAKEPFELERARAVIAGYCFGEVPEEPDSPSPAYGEALPAWRRPRFGYRSYDCQRGPGEGIDVVDIVAPVLLNVTQGYGVEIVSNLLAVAPVVNEVMRHVPVDVSFWTLPRGGTRRSSARHGELVPPPGLVPDRVGPRVWHHEDAQDPASRVAASVSADRPTDDDEARRQSVADIYDDLQRHVAEFAELEAGFATLAGARGGLPLTRLRLYDILLWCRVEDADCGG